MSQLSQVIAVVAKGYGLDPAWLKDKGARKALQARMSVSWIAFRRLRIQSTKTALALGYGCSGSLRYHVRVMDAEIEKNTPAAAMLLDLADQCDPSIDYVQGLLSRVASLRAEVDRPARSSSTDADDVLQALDRYLTARTALEFNRHTRAEGRSRYEADAAFVALTSAHARFCASTTAINPLEKEPAHGEG